jgi:hypothetical protein
MVSSYGIVYFGRDVFIVLYYPLMRDLHFDI